MEDYSLRAQLIWTRGNASQRAHNFREIPFRLQYKLTLENGLKIPAIDRYRRRGRSESIKKSIQSE